jgi:ABC-type transporter Mla subunit MlaD
MASQENIVIEVELDPAQLEQVLGSQAETRQALAELLAEVDRLNNVVKNMQTTLAQLTYASHHGIRMPLA